MTSKPLSDRLLDWLRGAVTGASFYARVETKPVPAPRPRVTRYGGAYYTREYMEFVNACQKAFSEARDIHNGSEGALEGALCAFVDVAAARPKSSKLSAPRGDADNHAKGVLDAATKCGVWRDDTQIECLAVTKRWTEAGEEPGVSLWVGRLLAPSK